MNDATTDDDAPVGRILTRRDVLTVLGISSAGLLAACAPGGALSASPAVSAGTATSTASPAAASAAGSVAVALPSCVVRPALTEGPYFVDEKLNRADIRADPSSGALRPGAVLVLTFNVSRVSSASCLALQGAQVDVWHCDAVGVYSDATDPSFNTKGQKFLRGYQVTDANGQAKFTTIYPGWYQGRAVHVHFKIRTAAANGAVSDFTSQLFFDETLNDQVLSQAPYSAKPASGRLRNSGDGIYQGGGEKLLVKPAQTGSGYAVSFDIGLAS
jgi:protocatechuate 3,4-dioxygenase beta subunit